MAHDVDLAFGQTHGGATRVRDKSNPDRFGNGYSAEAKRISLECKKLRRVGDREGDKVIHMSFKQVPRS